MKNIVIASGYFDPIHVGHINYFKGSKELGDYLIVILNNDEQAKIKKGGAFMLESERAEIVKAVKYVDEVFLSVDKGISVVESLRVVAKMHPGSEFVFANGGDKHQGNVPEVAVCNELNIKMVDNVGGKKVQSSSWLIKGTSKKNEEKTAK